jgi:mRNA-degrading endonuclease RelE of RelBE toxin-antitoxin system
MSREKRTAQRTVHFEPRINKALEQLREHEQRTFSSLVARIVERDPHVQLFIQKIERQVGN